MKDIRILIIGILSVFVICLIMYFHFEKELLNYIIVEHEQKLKMLEKEKGEIDKSMSEFSVDPETIRAQMEILRKTNQDCMICHSEGTSCKTCHSDFVGVIETHREKIESK